MCTAVETCENWMDYNLVCVSSAPSVVGVKSSARVAVSVHTAYQVCMSLAPSVAGVKGNAHCMILVDTG